MTASKTLGLNLVVALALVACGDKADDTGSGTGDDGGSEAVCTVAVELVSPTTGSEASPGDTILLSATATATSACGTEAPVFSWYADASPEEVVFSENNSPEAAESSFEATAEGNYVISVEACVGSTCGEDGPVGLEVGSGNTPPDADAGSPQTGKVGVEVILDGSATSDADGDELSYSWSFSLKPSSSSLTDGDIEDADMDIAAFTPDDVGIYRVELQVSDGSATSGAEVSITVE